MGQSYLDLLIYKQSLKLFVSTHRFSLKMPKHELYELGSQLRRSADSVNSNIVEGYGRRAYKKDYVRFLVFSHSSNLETVNHLRKISLVYPNLTVQATELAKQYDDLGRKLHNYIKYVKTEWRT